MHLAAERDVAVRAVRTAARACRYVQDAMIDPLAASKDDRTPVTVADYGAQAVVGRALKERFPDDGIISEEHGTDLLTTGARMADQVRETVVHVTDDAVHVKTICQWVDAGKGRGGRRQWVLDPVDGTKGFLRREQYAIALALMIDGQVRLGVLGCPELPDGDGGRGCLFVASAGRGAQQLPLDGGGEGRPVKVSKDADGPELVMIESVESAHADQGRHREIARRLGITREPVRYDSQVKYGVVARGEASIYLRLAHPTRPDHRQRIWDHAAGWIVVIEAGGTVTDVRGEPLDFSCGSRLANEGGVVCTNGACHAAVLAAVADGMHSV